MKARAKIWRVLLLGAVLLLIAAKGDAQTAQLTTLVQFQETNGAHPMAGLTLGRDGSFYGTTYGGGFINMGTIFNLTTNGAMTTLLKFTDEEGMGALPLAPLTEGNDGNFYGTTYGGGTNQNGTVFKITTNGLLTTLFTFKSIASKPWANPPVYTNANGSFPRAALILANDGSFYGSTGVGGTNGLGTIFNVTTNGALTTLLAFNIGTSVRVDPALNPTNYGAGPYAALTMAADGTFYGTTCQGGTNRDYNQTQPGINGLGTIFNVTTNGQLNTLFTFSPGADFNHTYTNADGSDPEGALTLGSDGLFYGTTSTGGSNGYGTVFKVTTDGNLTTLCTFNWTNGAFPLAGLTFGNDGNLYGTTSQGGANGSGSVFKLTTNGNVCTIYSFGVAAPNRELNVTNADGDSPSGVLTLGNDGSFYGTTLQGGVMGLGTVFKLTLGNASDSVSLNFQLLGTNLILSWSNSGYSLQSAPQVSGAYSTISGAASPYTNHIADGEQFFRLIGN